LRYLVLYVGLGQDSDYHSRPWFDHAISAAYYGMLDNDYVSP